MWPWTCGGTPCKELVRKERIAENASYDLLGTLANLTITLAAAHLAAYPWLAS